LKTLQRAAKRFDTSGKSPAYLHHRKNFKARAGNRSRAFSLGEFPDLLDVLLFECDAMPAY
jgi:hypothetical protein